MLRRELWAFGIALALAGPASAQDAEVFLPEGVQIETVPDGTASEGMSESDRAAEAVDDAAVYIGPYGGADFFESESPSQESVTYYERVLARWKDPFTLPHTRMECVKWARGDWPWGGGWKTCIGHKYQSQWLYVTAKLRVDAASPRNIQAAVEDCLRAGAVAGAVSGIVSGGTAAINTAVVVVKGCLASKVPDLINVSLDTSTKWNDWE